jgi:hypothetical protein
VCVCVCNFGFHKRRGIFSLADSLPDSQGLFYMELSLCHAQHGLKLVRTCAASLSNMSVAFFVIAHILLAFF